MELRDFLPLLVVHVKRWVKDPLLNTRVKDDRDLDVEERLPVRPGVTYWLRSVVVHSGEDNAGHYIAYVRTSSGAWVLYDDAHSPRVPPEGFSRVAACQAYILFYEK